MLLRKPNQPSQGQPSQLGCPCCRGKWKEKKKKKKSNYRPNCEDTKLSAVPTASRAPQIIYNTDCQPVYGESQRFLFARSKMDLFLHRHNHNAFYAAQRRAEREREEKRRQSITFLKPPGMDQPQCAWDEEDDQEIKTPVKLKTVTLVVPNGYCMSLP